MSWFYGIRSILNHDKKQTNPIHYQSHHRNTSFHPNLQLIKQYAQVDKPFYLLSKFFLEDNSVKTNSPRVMLFGVDNHYLKNKNLMDEDNKTNYGYIFPNDKYRKDR